MAVYTQIIDLYGILACGKTTLAEYMANHPKAGLKVATMRDCMHSALNNKWKLVKSISPKNFWVSVRFKFSAPFNKNEETFLLKEYYFWGHSKTTCVNTRVTT